MPRSMLQFYENHCEKFYGYYPRIVNYFKAKDDRIKALNIFGKLSTAAVYVSYVGLLLYLLVNGDARIVKAVAVPAAIFLVTTAVRKRINAPRPYEKYPITPLVHKSTKGRSCPSRHSACAFAIAFAMLYVNVPAGIIMLIISSEIAASRPVMGVHFPFDVIFGSVLAAAMGIVGFYIIP